MIVDVKGIGKAQFPDGMSTDSIRDFLRKKYYQQSVNGQSDILQPVDDVAAPYEPTLAEKMGQNVASALTGSGLISNNYRAQQIGENVTALGEFLPGIGDATAGDEFGRAIAKGDKFGMAMAGLGAIPVAGDALKGGARKFERLYHGSPVEFDEFDPSRMGDRLTSLGLGHYLTPNKSTAEQYGDKLMEFDVDTSDILDWQNMTKPQREKVEKSLMQIVPPDRIAGFGKRRFEVVPATKDGAKRFKELKEQTKDVYHHAARATSLTDDQIIKNHPGLIEKIGDNDNVVEWREGGTLEGANDQQLMTLMNEYSPNLAQALGFKGSRFADQVAIYDSKLAKKVSKSLPMDEVKSIDQLSESIKSKKGIKTLSLYEDRKGNIKLDTIIVDKDGRGSGVGSEAMEDIINYADKNNKLVKLTPAIKDDFQGTTSQARLRKFYKRFGFVENKGRNKDYAISELMYREPNN